MHTQLFINLYDIRAALWVNFNTYNWLYQHISFDTKIYTDQDMELH